MMPGLFSDDTLHPSPRPRVFKQCHQSHDVSQPTTGLRVGSTRKAQNQRRTTRRAQSQGLWFPQCNATANFKHLTGQVAPELP